MNNSIKLASSSPEASLAPSDVEGLAAPALLRQWRQREAADEQQRGEGMDMEAEEEEEEEGEEEDGEGIDFDMPPAQAPRDRYGVYQMVPPCPWSDLRYGGEPKVRRAAGGSPGGGWLQRLEGQRGRSKKDWGAGWGGGGADKGQVGGGMERVGTEPSALPPA